MRHIFTGSWSLLLGHERSTPSSLLLLLLIHDRLFAESLVLLLLSDALIDLSLHDRVVCYVFHQTIPHFLLAHYVFAFAWRYSGGEITAHLRLHRAFLFHVGHAFVGHFAKTMLNGSWKIGQTALSTALAHSACGLLVATAPAREEIARSIL